MAPRWLALAAALALGAREARAQDCKATGPRPPLCRNGFALDLYQGPLLAPSRVTALGGAYAALASGVDGLGQNTASAAVRLPYSFTTFDYDLSLGLSLPGAFGRTDFDNRGEVGLNSVTLFYTLGAQVQWGPWGFAALGDFQRYALAAQPNSGLPSAVVNIGRLRVATGWLLLRNQVTFGVGVRGVRATIDALDSSSSTGDIFLLTSTNLLTMIGVSPEAGLVIHPDFTPFRIGFTYRMPVTASGNPTSSVTRDTNGVRRAAGLALPDRVRWPWELEAGVALSAGPRPLNPRWIDPREHEAEARRSIDEARRAREQVRALELAAIEDPAARHARERDLARQEGYLRAEEEVRLGDLQRRLEEERRARFRNWPRARILVAADALLTGPTDDGIGIQSFLRQEDVASGANISLQPRLGLEGEPVPDRLVARIGTYLEPSRYKLPATPGVLAGTRQHFTFGLEVRTFAWDALGFIHRTDFTVHFVGDLAPRYQNFGLSIGAWH